MKNKGKVAILMATYNGDKYLTEQIDSILNQSYKNWELFISDDGSTDGTFSIINNYCNKYPEKIKNITNIRNTKSACENFLYLLSYIKKNFLNSFDFFMLCDQDDIWKSNKVYISVQSLKSTKPLLVHSDLTLVNKDNTKILNISYNKFNKINPNNHTLSKMLVQNNIVGCTMAWNKNLMNLLKFNINNNNIVMHDWYIAIVASCYCDIKFIPLSLINYRRHGDNVTYSDKIGSISYCFKKIFNTHHRDTPKSSLKKTVDQCKTILANYKVSSDKKYLLKCYANIFNHNKLIRIYLIFKNHFYQQTLLRTIGEIIFI